MRVIWDMIRHRVQISIKWFEIACTTSSPADITPLWNEYQCQLREHLKTKPSPPKHRPAPQHPIFRPLRHTTLPFPSASASSSSTLLEPVFESLNSRQRRVGFAALDHGNRLRLEEEEVAQILWRTFSGTSFKFGERTVLAGTYLARMGSLGW